MVESEVTPGSDTETSATDAGFKFVGKFVMGLYKPDVGGSNLNPDTNFFVLGPGILSIN